MKESLAKVADWVSQHRAAVLLTLAAGAAFYLLAVRGWPESWAGSVVFGLAGLAIALHFGHCFTRDLPDTEGELSTELRWVFRYAYGFLAIALLASVSPFVAPKDYFTSSETWAGVVDGCLRSEEGYGSELTRCDNDGSDQQWLLQIGSRSDRGDMGDAEAAGVLDGEAEAGTVRSELSRGLVVPLYVVVLAVFGGAVGMSRRVPEIQRGAAACVKEDSSAASISAIEARERVVFQIMQVLAAPLIAIAAFAAFEPDTMTAAVLIGFTSGFASETILMKLRQASEAVVGKKGRSA